MTMPHCLAVNAWLAFWVVGSVPCDDVAATACIAGWALNPNAATPAIFIKRLRLLSIIHLLWGFRCGNPSSRA